MFAPFTLNFERYFIFKIYAVVMVKDKIQKEIKVVIQINDKSE